ncbi:hypothetical protein E2C01_037509 [Portunus trituberculatus]|uniref:Uncharacterized protein n=1 Tax=Portunus trituberculatus TaxID=210409 RepID=A0A5B7FEA3_PORTR|nr:hypothetical protein [Portunus trituberculatus]
MCRGKSLTASEKCICKECGLNCLVSHLYVTSPETQRQVTPKLDIAVCQHGPEVTNEERRCKKERFFTSEIVFNFPDACLCFLLCCSVPSPLHALYRRLSNHLRYHSNKYASIISITSPLSPCDEEEQEEEKVEQTKRRRRRKKVIKKARKKGEEES